MGKLLTPKSLVTNADNDSDSEGMGSPTMAPAFTCDDKPKTAHIHSQEMVEHAQVWGCNMR